MNHWGRGFNLPGSIHLNPQPPHIDEHTNPLASHGFGLAHRFVVQKILGGSGHTLNKKKNKYNLYNKISQTQNKFF